MNAYFPFDEGSMVRLLMTLLHFLWQGGAVAAVTIGAGWILRRASSHVRYLVNVAAMLMMAICPIVTFGVVPVGQINRNIELVAANRVSPTPFHSTRTRGISPTVDAIDQPLTESGQADQAASTNSAVPVSNLHETETTTTGMRSFSDHLQTLAPHATIAYLVGVAVMLLRLARSLSKAKRLQDGAEAVVDLKILELVQRQASRMGLRVVPIVAWCQRVSVPVVIGVFRPVALLPATLATGLTPDQIEALLAHELAHIRRHDLWISLFQRLVEALLFFHPAVWYVSNRVSIEREKACDDLVLSAGWRRVEYAEALIRMAEVCLATRPLSPDKAASLAATGDNPTQFKRRVMRLLGGEIPPQPTISGRATLAIAVLATVALLLPALVHTRAQSPEDPIAVAPVREARKELVTSGVVVLTDGNPIRAEAEILICRSNGQIIQRTRTDSSGRFPVQDHWWDEQIGTENEILLVARDDQGRIGWYDFQQHIRTHQRESLEAAPGRPPVRIVLLDCDRLLKCRIVGPDAQPLPNVRVLVNSFSHQTNGLGASPRGNGHAGMFGYDMKASLPFPSTHTNDQGLATLRVPGDARSELRVVAPLWVTQKVPVGDEDDLGTIQLAAGGQIRGTVTDAKTGEAVARVTIAARGLSSDGKVGAYGYAVTDAEGRYRIGGLHPEYYNVQTGRQSDDARLVSPVHPAVQVNAGETTTVDFALAIGQPIRGQVLDGSSGLPIPEARVLGRVTREPNEMSINVARATKSDDEGNFELYVPPGICRISASAGPRASHPESQRTFEVIAGAKGIHVVLKLGAIRQPGQSYGGFMGAGVATPKPPRPTLRVELHTDRPAPIGEYIVRLIYKNAAFVSETSLRQGSQFDKEFLEREVGRVGRLLIDVPGFTPVTTPEFTVTAEMEPLKIDLEPAVYVPIYGSVIDPMGQALADARVRVRRIFHGSSTQFPWGVETSTDDQGRFLLKHLRAGERVAIHAAKEGLGETETDPLLIQAVEAIELPPLRIATADQEVSGVVTDQDGLPVPEATVAFTGQPPRSTKADSQGRFRLSGLPPGRLQLTLSAPDKSRTTRRIIAGSHDVRLFLPLRSLYDRPEYQLSVTLDTADGKTPENAKYYVLDSTERRWRQSGGFSGKLHKNIDLHSTIRRWPSNTLGLIVFANGYAVSQPIEIVTRPEVKPVAIDLQPAPMSTLCGRVVDTAGRPVAGAAIGVSLSLGDDVVVESWRYVSNMPEKPPATDAEGRFAIPDLHRGTRIALYTNAEGFAGTWSERVTIDESPQMTLPDLQLKRATRTIRGRITDTEDRPIAGARVRVHDFSSPETHSDADGRFELSAVPDGDLTLRAGRAGYDSTAQRFSAAEIDGGLTLQLRRDPAQFPPAKAETAATEALDAE